MCGNQTSINRFPGGLGGGGEGAGLVFKIQPRSQSKQGTGLYNSISITQYNSCHVTCHE